MLRDKSRHAGEAVAAEKKKSALQSARRGTGGTGGGLGLVWLRMVWQGSGVARGGGFCLGCAVKNVQCLGRGGGDL